MERMSRSDRRRRAGLGVLSALALAVALAATPPATRAADPTPEPTPSPTYTPAPTETPAPSATPATPTAVLRTSTIYRSDAVVRQFTKTWCVPASAQTMANLVLGRSDRTYATQKAFAARVRSYNAYTYTSAGNDVRGWAGALNWALPDSLPVVYRDRSYGSRSAAITAIVGAIDRTGYPVGIVVRRGMHAWTVLGYQASEVPGDPASRVDPRPVRRRVRSARRRIPGRTAYMTLATFASYFTAYNEVERKVIWHGRYVIVRPEPRDGRVRLDRAVETGRPGRTRPPRATPARARPGGP